jgi:hypothetical protein
MPPFFLAAKVSTPEVSAKTAQKCGFRTRKAKGRWGATQLFQNAIFRASFSRFQSTAFLYQSPL